MTTANQIIRSALGKIGINAPGEPVKPNDAEDCLRALNVILDAWRVERLYAYATQNITHTTLTEKNSLTIGPAPMLPALPPDIVVPSRPERFELGCFYSVGGTDYELFSITEAELNSITVKDVSAYGTVWFFYNPNLPTGLLRFYPRLQAGAALTLVAQVQLTAFADLTTDYLLPAGYERALIYTLAEEVAADFEREVPPTVARTAANCRRLIKRANHVVPQLDPGFADPKERFNILEG